MSDHWMISSPSQGGGGAMIWDEEMIVTDVIRQDAQERGGHQGAGKTQTQWATHACMGQKDNNQPNSKHQHNKQYKTTQHKTSAQQATQDRAEQPKHKNNKNKGKNTNKGMHESCATRQGACQGRVNKTHNNSTHATRYMTHGKHCTHDTCRSCTKALYPWHA